MGICDSCPWEFGGMYYITLLVAIVTAFRAARYCVVLATRIQRRWLRRSCFWLVIVPAAAVVCIVMFSIIDDRELLISPHYFLGILTPVCVFILAFIGHAMIGFRRNNETQMPRAQNWDGGRTGKRLLYSLVLLLVSTALFDLELQYRLRHLRTDTLNAWHAISQPTVPDAENAAVSFAKLQEWSETLLDWDERIEDLSIHDFDPRDEQFAGLRACDPVFDVLRSGSTRPKFYPQRDHKYPNAMSEDESISLLWKTLQLFRFNLLARAHRGEVAEAYDDLLVLQRTASLLDTDHRYYGRYCGTAARHMAMQSLERLLQRDPSPSDASLRSLLSNGPNPRRQLPELFAQTEAEHVTQLCDVYLGLLSVENEQALDLPAISRLPPVARYLIHIPNRLARAQDDLIAVRNRNDVYRSIAERWQDETITSDVLVDELTGSSPHGMLGPWPQGQLAATDSRDVLFHSAASTANFQQVTRIMAAVTLYQRRHGRFPDDLEELVPELLPWTPVCLRRGGRFHIRPIGSGRVIYGSLDADDIESDLEQHGTVLLDTLEYLECTVFVGDAYEVVHSKPVESDGGFAADSMASEDSGVSTGEGSPSESAGNEDGKSDGIGEDEAQDRP